jgi:hypothetical protein
VIRLADQIALRPVVKRGRMVNRTCGDPAGQLHERRDAADFETKTQEKLDASAAWRASDWPNKRGRRFARSGPVMVTLQ